MGAAAGHVHLPDRQVTEDQAGHHPHDATSVHNHSHDNHHHDHDHSHGHHHHHMYDTPATKLMEKLGLVAIADKLGHSWTAAGLSMTLFVAAMVVHLPAMGQLLSASVADALHSSLLTGTFLLSGFPQAVESISAASAGQIDTHVLMTLAVLGTLYMGLAHEVGS